MNERLKQTALGLLFWLAFAPFAIATILAQPICILLFAFGNDNIRAWVYRTGKALDQLNNASCFGGNPKETISSHAGRWYMAKPFGMPAWAEFVKWLTDKFEEDHILKAIEEPFMKEPL